MLDEINIHKSIFPENNKTLRVLAHDDEPWFCLSDLCDCMESELPNDFMCDIAREPLVADSISYKPFEIDQKIYFQDERDVSTFVNELVMLELVHLRHDQRSLQFKWWLLRETLPNIRRWLSNLKKAHSRLPITQWVVTSPT